MATSSDYRKLADDRILTGKVKILLRNSSQRDAFNYDFLQTLTSSLSKK